MLRKVLALLALSLVVFTANSQDRKFSVELNYPITLGDNFFEFNYSGIIDAGIDFYVAEAGIFDFGIGFNTGIFNSADAPDPGISVLVFDFKPSAFAELNIPGAEKFRPAVGVGYTSILFVFSGENPVEPSPRELIGEETRGGINFLLRLAYDFAERWFVQAQYDYTKLGRKGDVPNTSFNTNVVQLRLGLGFKF